MQTKSKSGPRNAVTSDAQLADNTKPFAEPHSTLLDVFVMLFLAFLICCVFSQTVLTGAPLTKLARLTLWDSAFAGFRKGTNGLMDPSLLQLMIPYYISVGKLWQAGQLPLWNQFSGCGMPLLADPQAQVFSPLHAVLAFSPRVSVYNAILLVELWIGAAGTFLLGRSLRLNTLPALSAAISFAFCPFLDRFLELIGSGYMFYPVVFWLFTRAIAVPTITSAALSGVSVAVMVLSGHPEVSFFGAAFGAIYALILSCLNPFESASSAGGRCLMALRQILISATVSFCLAAPLLLPFVEYLSNADSYKLAGRCMAQIPWQMLVLNLMQPAMPGASLYLGCLTVLCLPFCLLPAHKFQQRASIAVAITAVIAEAVTSRIFPFDFLLGTRFLSAIIPNYCQPVVLLLISIASGFGMQALMDRQISFKNRYGVLLIASLAFCTLAPLAVRLLHIPLTGLTFDTSLPQAHLSGHEWNRIACTTLAISVCWLLQHRRGTFVKFALAMVCLALSCSTLFSETRAAIPTQPKFEYPTVDSIRELKHVGGRYIATGEHLLKPNTNIVFGVSDLRFHNPMFPTRYRAFSRACGATLDGFNETFTAPLNGLIGLAGVKRVVSLDAVWSEHLVDNVPFRSVSPSMKWAGAELKAYSAIYDPNNRQLVGRMQWLLDQSASQLTYSLVVMDSHGIPLWFSDQLSFPQSQGQRLNSGTRYVAGAPESIEFGVPIPSKADLDSPVTIGIRIFDKRKMAFAAATNATIVDARSSAHTTRILPSRAVKLLAFVPATTSIANGAKTVLPLAKNKSPDAESKSKSSEQLSDLLTATDPNFALVKELPSMIRLYLVKKSVPEAYLVKNVTFVRTPREALNQIRAQSFDWFNQAVVESANAIPAAVPIVSQTDPSGNTVKATAVVERKNNHSVTIAVSAPQANLLVLTDTFFPGWMATLDGQPVDIVRANYLFRGIVVPAGNHSVAFSYEPGGLKLGLFLAGGCLVSLLALFLTAGLGKFTRH